MENEKVTTEQEKKVEELHWEIQQWKSHLQFMADEILFIDRLLDSYVFQPNTPNLFERLQDYKMRLIKAKSSKEGIHNRIATHESNLAGMSECVDTACDLTYYRKHAKLQTEIANCVGDFQNLKSEIFNYAGGILKKRKPTTE